MKESMREAFLRSATTPFCSGDPGPYPGTYPGGHYSAEIDEYGIVHCCDERCASGYHTKCNKVLTDAEIRRMGGTRGEVKWYECEPDVDEGSPLIRIALAAGLGLGAAWLGSRWAEAKSLSGWTGPVLGVLTAVLVLWLLWPRRKSL